jgi:hypothetical protein
MGLLQTFGLSKKDVTAQLAPAVMALAFIATAAFMQLATVPRLWIALQLCKCLLLIVAVI